MENKKYEGISEKFVRSTLDLMGFEDYELKTSIDGRGMLISVIIPKYNGKIVGILLGKGTTSGIIKKMMEVKCQSCHKPTLVQMSSDNRNIDHFRKFLKAIGYLEGKQVSIIIKLKENSEQR